MRKHKYNKDEVIKLHNEGKTLLDISWAMDVSRSWLMKVFREAGIKWHKEQKAEQQLARYEDG